MHVTRPRCGPIACLLAWLLPFPKLSGRVVTTVRSACVASTVGSAKGAVARERRQGPTLQRVKVITVHLHSGAGGCPHSITEVGGGGPHRSPLSTQRFGGCPLSPLCETSKARNRQGEGCKSLGWVPLRGRGLGQTLYPSLPKPMHYLSRGLSRRSVIGVTGLAYARPEIRGSTPNLANFTLSTVTE